MRNISNNLEFSESSCGLLREVSSRGSNTYVRASSVFPSNASENRFNFFGVISFFNGENFNFHDEIPHLFKDEL